MNMQAHCNWMVAVLGRCWTGLWTDMGLLKKRVHFFDINFCMYMYGAQIWVHACIVWPYYAKILFFSVLAGLYETSYNIVLLLLP